MGEAYPELRLRRDLILYTLEREETRFNRTLDSGLLQLDRILDDLHRRGQTVVPGDVAFALYATHGLPLELTRDVALEQHGMSVDEDGYTAAREQHALASGSGAFANYVVGQSVYGDMLHSLVNTGQLDDSGVDYDPYTGAALDSTILGLISDGQPVEVARAGQPVEVVTAATPFYVEAGGEVSDTGVIRNPFGGEVTVQDVRRAVPGLIIHIGQVVSGEFKVGQIVHLEVDRERRADIRRNHTATHLLHRELRAHLGKHVAQAGSLVAPDRLRFDFTHDSAIDRETLGRIERAINEAVLANQPVNVAYMGQKEAIAAGAMALFGEKYGDIVRTITVGGNGQGQASSPYSFELCGGLHVNETGEIGLFRFVSESAVGANTRRVEAVTGRGAYEFVNRRLALLDKLAGRLNTPVSEIETRLEVLLEHDRSQERQLEAAMRRLARADFEMLLGGVMEIRGTRVLAAQVDVADPDRLREMADWFRDRVKSGVAVLGAVKDGKPLIVAAVTEDLIGRGLKAGDIVREVAKVVGGGGGGRADMAQAGGRHPEKLAEALATVRSLVEATLKE